MSRVSRTIVAGGAALALLAGSGATFARWYDEKPLTDATVTTGKLSLKDVDGAKDGWKINKKTEDETEDPSVPFNPATDKLVPGDIVSFTDTFQLELEGKNLDASLALVDSNGGQVPGFLSVTANSVDCGAAALDLHHLTQADNGRTCEVSYLIEFPIGADTDANSAIPENQGDGAHGNGWVKPDTEHGQSVSLNGVRLVLEQNKRPSA